MWNLSDPVRIYKYEMIISCKCDRNLSGKQQSGKSFVLKMSQDNGEKRKVLSAMSAVIDPPKQPEPVPDPGRKDDVNPKGGSDAVNTADSQSILIWIALMMAALAGCAAICRLMVCRRRPQRKKERER